MYDLSRKRNRVGPYMIYSLISFYSSKMLNLCVLNLILISFFDSLYRYETQINHVVILYMLTVPEDLQKDLAESLHDFQSNIKTYFQLKSY